MGGFGEFFGVMGTFLNKFFVQTVINIRIRDIIDILLLTFVLFFVYTLIRDSRAWKLLVGLGVLLLISIISEAFDMNALSFIFSDFQSVGLLAILVLFQPELRTALEKVGGTPITGIKSISAESKDLATRNAEIDAICTAASELSRDKVGALIVIERSTKLGDFVKSGVYVDATISPYMLRNIFFNNAPLHDGAVIIRNSRICAAGCFLPLSTKEDIDKDLGTRHRAAIGLTEISDALVIVVSEETGTVSLSIDGNLERNYNYNTLKQALNTHLNPLGTVESAKHRTSKSRKKGSK
ncbi:MAG: TIGR00159 family protein [Ruminococcaceae bacterium]|nr:TIGR00159 family protein [Oscillospiraceae bacterium]